jgi:hypothetical protein
MDSPYTFWFEILTVMMWYKQVSWDKLLCFCMCCHKVFHINAVRSPSGSNIRLRLPDPADQHSTHLCDDKKHRPDTASHPRINKTILNWTTVCQLFTFTNFEEKIISHLWMTSLNGHATRVAHGRPGKRFGGGEDTVQNCQKLWPLHWEWDLGLPAQLKMFTQEKQYYISNSCWRYSAPCVTCTVHHV